MKKLRIIALMLALLSFSCLLAGCRREEEEKPKLSLSDVLAISDGARDLPITYFSKYDYVVLGSTEIPLYYFQLKEIDFAFSVGMDENGQIESMMLSHISGSEVYLFHKNPGRLDPNATQYTEDAKSYDLQKFIDKMTEN